MINRGLYKNKKLIPRLIAFVKNVYKGEKQIELLSFIFWNICYKLGLYNKQLLLFSRNRNQIYVESLEDIIEIKNSSYKISLSEYNWTFMYLDSKYNIYGSTIENPNTLIKVNSNMEMKEIKIFSSKIKGIFIDRKNNILVCSNGIIYKSENGESFIQVLKLSTERSYFLRDGVTQSPNGDIFIGEYANIIQQNGKWKFVGYLYHSNNDGDTWIKYDFLKNEGVNKHIHIVKWSKHINGLILTEGDNYKRTWYNQSSDFKRSSSNPKNGWKKVNTYHIQKGGHTGIVETKNNIIFGSDYMGGTNFLITTEDMKKFRQKVVPEPYRRALFRRMELITDSKGIEEIWANLNFEWNKKVKNLILYKRDTSEWKKVIEYNGEKLICRLVSRSVTKNNRIYITFTDREKQKSKTIIIETTQ